MLLCIWGQCSALQPSRRQSLGWRGVQDHTL